MPLDLELLIELGYRNGGYDDDIDYHNQPDPPLDGEDDSWSSEPFRSLGRR